MSPPTRLCLADLLANQRLLRVVCTTCRHERIIGVDSLAQRFGMDVPLSWIATKFRCSACNARTVEAHEAGEGAVPS